ncbi:MAG: type II CRISPR-associated endonuclease Cas1 [Rhodospirillum sp.]|nr:type II CRISPR-associated endonuclease Cas1 [Rhodospirillum sp.]MCF8488629.1 type II CRISPR-associated endonuclease Cas1 [Rhodospirillum sp.]
MAVIEIASRGTVVSARDRLLAIGDTRLHVDDIDLVIAQVPAVTLTGDALALLGRAGIDVVICDDRRQPLSTLVPVCGSAVVSARLIRLQAAMIPRKRAALWRGIVRAKITEQARVLEVIDGPSARLRKLAEGVEAGDPTNLEAQAARLYWPALMGAAFRRHGGSEADTMLDFGYAVLRAVVARRLHGAGLHRSLGIHHDNAENDGNLADDMIEPFRPAVDRLVLALAEQRGGAEATGLDPKIRAALAEVTDWPVRMGGEWIRLRTAVARVALSLRAVVEGGPARLDLPEKIGSVEDARRMAEDVGSGLL